MKIKILRTFFIIVNTILLVSLLFGEVLATLKDGHLSPMG